MPFEHRGTRAEEMVDILRLAWSGEPVKYQGQFYSMDVGPIGTRPIRSRIPIWFGGSARTGAAAPGRIADGFIGGSSRGAEGFRESMETSQRFGGVSGTRFRSAERRDAHDGEPG